MMFEECRDVAGGWGDDLVAVLVVGLVVVGD